MLTLTRRDGESIKIWTSDGLITILMKAAVEGSASIGIGAPRHCKILRQELEPHNVEAIDVDNSSDAKTTRTTRPNPST